MAMIYKMGDAYLSASLTPKGLELRKVALSGKPDGAPVLVSRDVLEDAFRSGGKIDYFPRCCEALPDYSESPIWSDGAYEILCDNRGKNGIPGSIRALLDDADDIDGMIEELYIALHDAAASLGKEDT